MANLAQQRWTSHENEDARERASSGACHGARHRVSRGDRVERWCERADRVGHPGCAGTAVSSRGGTFSSSPERLAMLQWTVRMGAITAESLAHREGVTLAS